MKKALIIFLMGTALVGCKGNEALTANNNANGNGGLGGLTIPEERIYTGDELVIGRRICSAPKTKREFFEKLRDQQEQVQLRGENRNCEQTVFNSTEFIVKVSNASSNELEYIALNRSNYLNDILTDQSSALKRLCDDLNVSNSVSNTSLNGSSYLIINLLISNGYDRMEISKKTRDASGNYPLVSIEGVNIFTRENQISKKFLGAEQERIRYVACPGTKNSSYIKQNWLTAITSF